jgi:GT2 family glycosyltransferase
MEPVFSIIVPNWNGMEHLPECFSSLAAADYPRERQEWIVSDNGSGDGSQAWLRGHYPRVRLVENGRNIGFAAGCNAGARAATGDWLVFLNNDTRVQAGWLRGYLAALARDPEAVCAASYMRSWDDTEPDFDGGSACLFGTAWQRPVIGWPDQPAPLGEGDPLLFACGGAMCIRRDVFEAVGGFDERFFIYFEDVDLGWRLWVLGHKVVFAPKAVVYHKEGGTTGATRVASHRRYGLFERNTLALLIKNYEAAHLDTILPAALLLEWQRAIQSAGTAIDRPDYRLDGGPAGDSPAVHTLAGLPPMSVAHMLAMHRLGEILPGLMADRTRIQAARRRPDREIWPLFGKPFAPQFGGPVYADMIRRIAAALNLYEPLAEVAPNRILILSSPDDPAGRGAEWARLLGGEFHVLHNPPDPAAVVRDADLVIAVGTAVPQAVALTATLNYITVPVAADVRGLTPGGLPRALAETLAQKTALLIAADAEQAAAWEAATGRPVRVQPPGTPLTETLRQYCRYPLHQPEGTVL